MKQQEGLINPRKQEAEYEKERGKARRPGEQRKELAWEVARIKSSQDESPRSDKWVACTVLIARWGTNQDEWVQMRAVGG